MKSTFSPDKAYLTWFTTLTRIPPESRNERQLSDFLVSFAKERGLEVTQDAIGNILIRKPGTRGMENAPAVILQGHMDMVCVKDEGLDFDFSKDPLNLVVEGDSLHAEGTTLGADNGIALAYILTVLDSSDIPHPPLEAVVTVQEEVGMGGAHAFDASLLTASAFINMDSEDEGVFCVSCAGGRRSQMHIPAVTAEVASLEEHDAYAFRRITVSGLAGGHSGLEIIKERGNSNKLLARDTFTGKIYDTGNTKTFSGSTIEMLAPENRTARLSAAISIDGETSGFCQVTIKTCPEPINLISYSGEPASRCSDPTMPIAK